MTELTKAEIEQMTEILEDFAIKVISSAKKPFENQEIYLMAYKRATEICQNKK